jgi:FKBP-type peptidyl-prolyl cis-trans isomerase (trigger factor)
MNWKRINSDNGDVRLDVQAEWSELAADYDDIVMEHATVAIPGFRAGKAPRGLIEKRFRREIVDQLSRRAAQRLGREAVVEAGIEVLGSAEAEEIECAKDQPFRASLRFHPMPAFDLPELDSLLDGDADADPRDRISLRLLEQVVFDVPDALVQDELASGDVPDCGPGSDEWTAASDRVRLMVILKKIAAQEGVEVDDVDVKNRLAEKAAEFATREAALRSEIERGGGVQRLRDMLLAESTLDYLVEMNT